MCRRRVKPFHKANRCAALVPRGMLDFKHVHQLICNVEAQTALIPETRGNGNLRRLHQRRPLIVDDNLDRMLVAANVYPNRPHAAVVGVPLRVPENFAHGDFKIASTADGAPQALAMSAIICRAARNAKDCVSACRLIAIGSDPGLPHPRRLTMNPNP